jgi:hypothetical protein
MKKNRDDVRYSTFARICIDNNKNSMFFLKDISLTGYSITNTCGELAGPETGDELRAQTYPEMDREYKVLIFPEAESRIGSFELAVEFCWSRIQGIFYEAGGLISGYPGGTQYQLFANYLAWRTAHT